MQAVVRILKAGAWIVAIAVLIVVGMFVYDELELRGYVSHQDTMNVYMTNDWLVGENRDCTLYLQFDAQYNPTGGVEGMYCSVGERKLESHNLKVTLWGSETALSKWTCTHESDGWSCKKK